MNLIILLLVIALILSGSKKMEDTKFKFLIHYISNYNPKLNYRQVRDIATSIEQYSNLRGIDIWAFTAIAQRESSFDPSATGDHVSRGIYQLTKLALDELVRKKYIHSYDWDMLYSIDYNVRLASQYFLYCYHLSNGNLREAVARYRKTYDPYSSTAQSYADDVMKIREEIINEYNEFKK